MLIDMDEVMQRLDGDEEMIEIISSAFLDDWSTSLKNIENAAKSLDSQSFRRESHSLKSVFAAIGAQVPVDFMRNLELNAMAGNFPNDDMLVVLNGFYSELEKEIFHLFPHLKENK